MMQVSERSIGQTLSASSQVAPSRPFHVLVDARKLGDGGIGTYTLNLLRGLAQDGQLQLSALCRPTWSAQLKSLGKIACIEDETPKYSTAEYFGLSAKVARCGADVFHVPHYTLPYAVPIPTVITVHDLIHIRAPEKFYYPLIARPLIRSALRRADKIITVSEASRRDILSVYATQYGTESKIAVIPNAIDPEISAFSSPRGRDETAAPFLLGVFSNSKPHKGRSALLEAFARFKAERGRLREGALGERLQLMLVGPGAKDVKPFPGLVCVGEVPRQELFSLYQRALGTIVTSTIEGFCLPALESRALGTPVISTPVPAILELLGKEDVVCADFTPLAIEAGIRRFVDMLEKSPAGAIRVDSAPYLREYDCLSLARRVIDVYRSTLPLGRQG